MAEDCSFCNMFRGKEAYVPVYQDDGVLAIMDNHPINPGHVLVVPRTHVESFHQLDDDAYLHLMSVSKELADVLDYVFEPERVGLLVAGFDLPHVHVHLVPMHEYQDLTSKKILEGTRENPSLKNLRGKAEEIRSVLGEPE